MCLAVNRVAVPDATLSLPRAMALGLAATMALLLVPWNYARISANDLLARAASSETRTAKQIESGVVYQKVHIRTAKCALERSVYRDAEGRRRPRDEALAADDAQLEARQALAGVSSEQPLSALSYKQWHDLQAVSKDEIRQTGSYLTVITTVPSGAAVQASLMVRRSDFHPNRAHR